MAINIDFLSKFNPKGFTMKHFKKAVRNLTSRNSDTNNNKSEQIENEERISSLERAYRPFALNSPLALVILFVISGAISHGLSNFWNSTSQTSLPDIVKHLLYILIPSLTVLLLLFYIGMYYNQELCRKILRRCVYMIPGFLVLLVFVFRWIEDPVIQDMFVSLYTIYIGLVIILWQVKHARSTSNISEQDAQRSWRFFLTGESISGELMETQLHNITNDIAEIKGTLNSYITREDAEKPE